ncbi:MAG: hypothetical protein OEL89_03085, partial [Candidatus Peregrinibacteria bacterium]|nr:hypothetical protein [Candidatus Peregrinibacteria bacterium]
LYADFNGTWFANETNQTVLSSGVWALINVTGIQEGNYVWGIYSCDGYDNCGFGATNYSLTVDQTAPVLEIIYPSNGTYSADSTLDINYTLVEDNLDSCWYSNSSGQYNYTLNCSENITSLVWGEELNHVILWANDSAGNINSSEVSFTIDSTFPLITSTPLNNSAFSQDFIFVNASVVEANFRNITFNLYNSAMSLLNSTSYVVETTEINWTGLTPNTDYYYNITVYDQVNNSNTTGLLNVLLDTISPVVNNLSGMVGNGDVGGSMTLFNWSVSDNIDTNISCYPTYTNSVEDNSTVVSVNNNSENNVTIGLPGGLHNITVTCYDDANNSDNFTGISYLVGQINLSSPWISDRESKIVRYQNITKFVIDEIYGEDFLDNVSVSIFNGSSVLDTITTWVSDNNAYEKYNLSDYTWGNYPQPFYLTIKASAFNTSAGVLSNVTEVINMTYLRPLGTTANPDLISSYSNLTYNFNDTTVKISLVADLDSLFFADNVTVVDPDFNSYQLVSSERLIDQPGFMDYLNYTFEINKTGNYTIFADIQDYEGTWGVWVGHFYSSNISKEIQVNDTREMLITDVVNRRSLWNGTNLSLLMPGNSLYDVAVNVTDILRNVSLAFHNVNFTENLSSILSYDALSNETDAPSGQRRVALFDLESNLTYESYNLTIDYSPIASSLNDESTLKLYKCSNASNCILALQSSTLNQTLDTLTTTLYNMSRFMLTEDSTEVVVEVPVQAPSAAGGGASTTLQYISLDIITTEKAEMGLADQIIVPVHLRNNIKGVELNDLTLTATPNAKDLSTAFDRDFIKKISPGDEEMVNLIIDSHSDPGDYEIDLNVTVKDPDVMENSKIFIKLVEGLSSSFVSSRVALVKDLFKENPACLEYNDYLIEAEKILGNDPAKAKELVEFAISSCRDLITSKEWPLTDAIAEFGGSRWVKPVVVSLILLVISMIIVMWTLRRRKFSGKSVDHDVKSKAKKKFSLFSFKRKQSPKKKSVGDLFKR